MIELIADYIESLEFDFEINVAGGLTNFIGIIEELNICRALELELRQPFNVQWLGSHIKQLANEDINPKYEHPKDIALAVYIYFLCRFHPEYLVILDYALENTPNLWWTRKMLSFLNIHP